MRMVVCHFLPIQGIAYTSPAARRLPVCRSDFTFMD